MRIPLLLKQPPTRLNLRNGSPRFILNSYGAFGLALLMSIVMVAPHSSWAATPVDGSKVLVINRNSSGSQYLFELNYMETTPSQPVSHLVQKVEIPYLQPGNVMLNRNQQMSTPLAIGLVALGTDTFALLTPYELILTQNPQPQNPLSFSGGPATPVKKQIFPGRWVSLTIRDRNTLYLANRSQIFRMQLQPRRGSSIASAPTPLLPNNIVSQWGAVIEIQRLDSPDHLSVLTERNLLELTWDPSTSQFAVTQSIHIGKQNHAARMQTYLNRKLDHFREVVRHIRLGDTTWILGYARWSHSIHSTLTLARIDHPSGKIVEAHGFDHLNTQLGLSSPLPALHPVGRGNFNVNLLRMDQQGELYLQIGNHYVSLEQGNFALEFENYFSVGLRQLGGPTSATSFIHPISTLNSLPDATHVYRGHPLTYSTVNRFNLPTPPSPLAASHLPAQPAAPLAASHLPAQLPAQANKPPSLNSGANPKAEPKKIAQYREEDLPNLLENLGSDKSFLNHPSTVKDFIRYIYFEIRKIPSLRKKDYTLHKKLSRGEFAVLVGQSTSLRYEIADFLKEPSREGLEISTSHGVTNLSLSSKEASLPYLSIHELAVELHKGKSSQSCEESMY